ncbi:hypothetical protein MBEHAL_1979 [Halarchaeum acidiphilum MH1-52-1]|uniref:Uncharacterized protein n=1 Tax=Halarchaeum acidiphilum MH1-52-1 TaxID=1261545 RepID=U3A6C8_9EURY|nr:hypothetical protein MBEHAL_1979 [Halarchaeum acidiphilum MH1-52-1]
MLAGHEPADMTGTCRGVSSVKAQDTGAVSPGDSYEIATFTT